MLDLRLLDIEILPRHNSIAKVFAGRLIVSFLITAVDVAVLIAIVPIAYQSGLISTFLPIGFALLALGMGASLGRMWWLTVQMWR
jgi:hypothetical protein